MVQVTASKALVVRAILGLLPSLGRLKMALNVTRGPRVHAQDRRGMRRDQSLPALLSMPMVGSYCLETEPNIKNSKRHCFFAGFNCRRFEDSRNSMIQLLNQNVILKKEHT